MAVRVIGDSLVGLHDPFLELGGDSLRATQVMSRVQQAFSTRQPLRQLFQTPTVAELATAIAAELAGNLEEEQLTDLLTEVEEQTGTSGTPVMNPSASPHHIITSSPHQSPAPCAR
jgi:phosphopantetheine binding protein